MGALLGHLGLKIEDRPVLALIVTVLAIALGVAILVALFMLVAQPGA